MDETYADLVRYQVDLEEKNSSLEAAQQFIASVLASMTDVLIVCDARAHPAGQQGDGNADGRARRP